METANLRPIWHTSSTSAWRSSRAGHVDDVDISLIRAAYAVDRLRIVKTDDDVPVPFVAVRRIDLSVDWGELLHGKILAEVEFDRPVLNFVVAGGGSDSQTGKEVDWRDAVDDLVPITVHHLIVRGGEVHYRGGPLDLPLRRGRRLSRQAR